MFYTISFERQRFMEENLQLFIKQENNPKFLNDSKILDQKKRLGTKFRALKGWDGARHTLVPGYQH